jgi:chromosome segregation ATPase
LIISQFQKGAKILYAQFNKETDGKCEYWYPATYFISIMSESPERRKRLEEQRTLSDLNKSLESYIITIRSIQARYTEQQSGPSGISLEEHEARIREIAEQYENLIRAVQQENVETQIQVDEFNRIIQRKEETIKELNYRVDQLEAEKALALQKMTNVVEQLEEHKRAIEQQDGLVSNVRLQSEEAEHEKERLEKEVEALKAEVVELETQINFQNENISVKLTELETENELLRHERETLARRIDEFGQNADEMSNALLKDRMQQLEHEFNQMREAAMKEKDAVLNQQFADFNEQYEKMRKAHEALLNERNDLLKKLNDALGARLISDKERANFEFKIKELEQQYEHANEALLALQKRYNNDLSRKDAEAEALRADLAKYQDERNALTGLAISIIHSVEEFDHTTQLEEEKLNIVPPVSKKRRLEEPSPSSPLSKAAPKPDSNDQQREPSSSASPRKPVSKGGRKKL